MSFPNTLPLIEAFRVILRDLHPGRPELADEIANKWWFTWPSFQRPTPPEEVEAANLARKTLLEAVYDKRIRLQGCLDRDQIDIHPSDIVQGALDIFDGVLKVDARRKTYRGVEGYTDDVHALLSARELRQIDIKTRLLSPYEAERAAGSPSGFQNKQARLKKDCIDWIRTFPAAPIMKRKPLEQQARQRFQGLSGRQFLAAWDEAAPPPWKKGGRRNI